MNLFNVPPRYSQKDGGAGDDSQTDDSPGGDDQADEAGKKKRIEFSAEQQAEVNRIIEERLKREREKSKTEAEARENKVKDAAEKKALEEQGKFKELAESAEKRAADEKERADAAEKKAQSLFLQRKFDEAVAALEVKFVNPKASEDAFAHLDAEAVGEDFSGMEAAVKKLIEDREYLFTEVEPQVRNIDATEKGKVKANIRKDDIVKRKRQTGQYSGV